LLETELVEEYGGILEYNLSLSAEPKLPVTVVVSPDIRSPSCYDYEPKFLLRDTRFEFTAQTYNVPQIVVIEVNNLNKEKYEGTFTAAFIHTIITDDEQFQSAFLRPVSVALQDDSACVAGSEKYEQIYADKSRVRKCGCQEGFYVHSVDEKFCDSVVQCEKCPVGMECGL
jgi:hypothetical protein